MKYLDLSKKEKKQGFLVIFYKYDSFNKPHFLLIDENGIFTFPYSTFVENEDIEDNINIYLKNEFQIDLEEFNLMLVNTGHIFQLSNSLFKDNLENDNEFEIFEMHLLDYDQFFTHNKKKKDVYWMTKGEIMKSNMKEEMKKILDEFFN